MADRDLVRKDRLSSPASPPRGTNYLLAIAINDYQHCTKLNNAVLDAEVFIEVMTSRYNFEAVNVTFIKDTEATKRRIEQEFFRLIKTITPQDNLIVYFSGHGRHDEHFGGNWVPVDAGTTDDDWPDYLSNDTIKSYLSKIKSFHTFLIADSCFSGSLFIDKSKEKFSGDRRDTEPSRWGLTSGKKEIVSDGRPGTHSPFATALLDVLRKADQPPGVMRICDLVLEKVAANAQQTPMGSPLQVQGHQGGQLVFYFREDEESEWLQLSSSAEGCRTYLTKYPEGKYRSLAEEIVAKYQYNKAWQQAKIAGTKYALLDFERDFPNSSPVLSGELHRQLVYIEEEELWAEACQFNTVSAYRMYLTRSVLKNHTAEASAAIKDITEKDHEYIAWEKAKQLNTQAAFETYLKDYPQGTYATRAIRILGQLWVEAERNQYSNPLSKERIDQEPVLAKLNTNALGPAKKEPVTHLKLRWDVTLSIIGLILLVLLGNKIIGLFSTERKSEAESETKLEKISEKIISDLHKSMVFVPGGEFQMGSNDGDSDEKPVHTVALSGFYIGKTEVTQAQWWAIMGNNPSAFKNCDKCPVEQVSWDDVQEFIQKLNAKTGKTYRLPTEAEWEYVARGGKNSTYTYAGSDNVEEVAWYDSNAGGKTHRVARKQASELDLYDMSGNLYEWCQDWYDENYYSKSPSKAPQGPDKGYNRVIRGGSWYNGSADVRVANRNLFLPSDGVDNVGFRLARQQ